MANKILVLSGVQGSGKTSWAKEFLKNKKNWVRVSRDDIRLARGDYWIPEQETYISKVEDFQVNSALDDRLNVIIDAMNLNPKTIAKWELLAKQRNVEIEFKRFEVEYEEGWKRLEERNKSGIMVITKKVYTDTFKKYFPDKFYKKDDRIIKQPDDNLPKCVICDLDGTLSISQGRNPFDYSKVDQDYCDPRLKNLLNVLYNGYYSNEKGTKKSSVHIIFISGREGTKECLEKTNKFLQNAGFNDYRLYTRAWTDYRSDDIVKKELYEQYIENKYDVLAVFDDRDKVCKMWRELGLLCCQVYYGDF